MKNNEDIKVINEENRKIREQEQERERQEDLRIEGYKKNQGTYK